MTQGYQCDRCGEWHQSPVSRGFLTLKLLGVPMHRDYGGSVDLCEDCEGAFSAFMENKDAQNNE